MFLHSRKYSDMIFKNHEDMKLIFNIFTIFKYRIAISAITYMQQIHDVKM